MIHADFFLADDKNLALKLQIPDVGLKERMKEMAEKSKNGHDLTPLSKYREWKVFYYQPGRPGLENGNYHLGLCKFCRLNRTCPQPRPEAGVWRCSDYVPLPTRRV